MIADPKDIETIVKENEYFRKQLEIKCESIMNLANDQLVMNSHIRMVVKENKKQKEYIRKRNRILDMILHYWRQRALLNEKMVDFALSQLLIGKNPFLQLREPMERVIKELDMEYELVSDVFTIFLENDPKFIVKTIDIGDITKQENLSFKASDYIDKQ